MILILQLLLVIISGVNAEQQFSTMFSPNINVSEGCKTAVQKLSSLQTAKPQLMAYYWDSWGKPSDSLLTGHTTFLGYYDECMNLKNTDLGDMKYCIYPMVMDINIMQSPSEFMHGVCHSMDCPVAINASTLLNVKVGVCYPSACSANEFAVVLSKMSIKSVTTMMSDPFSDTANTLTVTLNTIGDSPSFCPVTDVEYDAGTVALIVVCAILVGLVMAGTMLDIVLWLVPPNIVTLVANEKLKNGKDNLKETDKEILSVSAKERVNNQPTIKDFILAFSLYTTIPNLLKRQSPSTLKALGAIKIFSNLIIVINHVFRLNYVFFSGSAHNSYLEDYPTRFSLQPVVNGTFAVEAFFVVSGTLSAYLALKDIEKHKRFRFRYFYLNRFFRLSPLYYFYTFITYKLSARFGQGPLWFSYDAIACVDSWWYNVLYLTNTRHIMKTCLAPSWSLSADVQLFIISPVFITLLYHVWYIGLAAVTVAMIGATATVGYVASTNGYWAAMHRNPQVTDQQSGLHVQAFYRANGYLTGILLGYILYKKYNIATLPIGNCLKRLIYTLLWIAGITLCLVTMFGTYGEYSFSYHFSDFENVTFLMFSGLAWSMGIAIIIYICNTGYGGAVNSFLSWPGWEPLVKLNYGVALCNSMVIFFIMGTLQSGLKYTDKVFAMIVVFTMAVSYSVSAITAILVQLPISKVVSLCFKLAGEYTRS